MTMENITEILFLLAYVGASVGCIELLSMGSLTGARLVTGFIVDDEERAQTTAAMFWLVLISSVLSCFAMFLLTNDLRPALFCAACAFISWIANQRGERFFGKPNGTAIKTILEATRPIVLAAILYVLPVSLVVVLHIADTLIVPGYLLGLLLIAFMQLGLSEADTQANGRCTFLALAAITIALVAALAICMIQSTLGETFAIAAALPVYACALGFVLMNRPNHLPDLIPAVLITATLWFPTLYAQIAAGALFVLFLLWKRRALYEAFLPIRAKWIRMRANRR